MNFLPEVYLEPRNTRLDFVDNPDYDPDLDYDPNSIWISQICMKLLP